MASFRARVPDRVGEWSARLYCANRGLVHLALGIRWLVETTLAISAAPLPNLNQVEPS